MCRWGHFHQKEFYVKALRWERIWVTGETERPIWLVCRETGWVVREDTLEQKSAGEDQDPR